MSLFLKWVVSVLCHRSERCFIGVRDSRLPVLDEIPGKRCPLNWALATTATETLYSIAPSQLVLIVRDFDTAREIFIAKWRV